MKHVIQALAGPNLKHLFKYPNMDNTAWEHGIVIIRWYFNSANGTVNWMAKSLSHMRQPIVLLVFSS